MLNDQLEVKPSAVTLANSVYVILSVTSVGVPEITPVTGSITIPAGNSG